MGYVLIENYANGCFIERRIISVTLSQGTAYTWLKSIPPIDLEFITREVKEVPIV